MSRQATNRRPLTPDALPGIFSLVPWERRESAGARACHAIIASRTTRPASRPPESVTDWALKATVTPPPELTRTVSGGGGK